MFPITVLAANYADYRAALQALELLTVRQKNRPPFGL
jgi:hypothetical protein